MPIEERRHVARVISVNDRDCIVRSLPSTAITDQSSARLIITTMTQSLLAIFVPRDLDLPPYLLMLVLEQTGTGSRFSTVVLLLRLEKTIMGHVMTTVNPRAFRKGTEW